MLERLERLLGWWLFIDCLVVLAWVAVIGVYSYVQTHPQPARAAGNRAQFADIIVAIDATGSIRNDHDVSDEKQIVTDGIIGGVGPWDKVACYAIGPAFGDGTRIFGGAVGEQGDQVPHPRDYGPPNLNDARVWFGSYELIREVRDIWPAVEQKREEWRKRVNALQRPAMDGSLIKCQLAWIRSLIGVDRDRERSLFVLSDMIDDSRGLRRCPEPDPQDWDDVASTRIVVITPNVGGEHGDVWPEYFGKHEIEHYSLGRALLTDRILPPNPLEGLQRYEVAEFPAYFGPLWNVGRPWAVLTLVVPVAGLLATRMMRIIMRRDVLG